MAGIAGLGILGLVVAMLADSPWWDDGWAFDEAAREIGGALVSGAVLATIVVRFEQRRDDERERLVALREQDLSHRAWQRSLRGRLIQQIRGPVFAARGMTREELRHRRLSHVHEDAQFMALWRQRGVVVPDLASLRIQTGGLVHDTRDPETIDAWQSWEAAMVELDAASHNEDVAREAFDVTYDDAWLAELHAFQRLIHAVEMLADGLHLDPSSESPDRLT